MTMVSRVLGVSYYDWLIVLTSLNAKSLPAGLCYALIVVPCVLLWQRELSTVLSVRGVQWAGKADNLVVAC